MLQITTSGAESLPNLEAPSDTGPSDDLAIVPLENVLVEDSHRDTENAPVHASPPVLRRTTRPGLRSSLARVVFLLLLGSACVVHASCAPGPSLECSPSPGLSPGLPPGLSPGLPPGLSPGLSPGLPPGLSPGLPPGLSPGLPPGLSPGLPPGLPPGLSPGLSPGLPSSACHP
uniref:Uncharacterized protein n=1 Tax=Knipowitschia caucasica TaxID=637954 RepID=A0AAV2LXY4_KNICA